MNRDWHNNPSQGGSRSTHDYGNSGPIEPQRTDYKVQWWEVVAGCALVFGVTLALLRYAL